MIQFSVALLLLGALQVLIKVSSAYQQVVRAGAADPSIVYAHGWYHMTYTAVDNIEMARSRTLKGLLIGEVRSLYTEFNMTAGREANMVCTPTLASEGTSLPYGLYIVNRGYRICSGTY